MRYMLDMITGIVALFADLVYFPESISFLYDIWITM
jgi:hypothetical protein